MTVKLDSAVGYKKNDTEGEAQYKNHIKTISNIVKDTSSPDKFEAHKTEIDQKIKTDTLQKNENTT